MDDASPFYSTKYELTGNPLIWIPPWINSYEGDKSRFLCGGRGTGKTTLLQVLNYDTRMHNASLKAQLHGTPYSQRYIGLYFRLPDYTTNVWHLPSNPVGSCQVKIEHYVFSLFLEFQFLQSFIKAICDLRDNNHLVLNGKQETLIITKILEYHDELENYFTQDEEINTLRDMGRLFRRVHTKILKHVFPKPDFQEYAHLLSGNIGAHLESITKIIIDGVSATEPNLPQWRIKICIDEAECLTVEQQKVLNTLIRLAKSPISYIVAYIPSKKIDRSATLIFRQTVAEADCVPPKPLEQMSRMEFSKLTTSVVNLYLETAGAKGTFDPKRMLGPTHINALLLDSINKNRNESAKKLKEVAEKYLLGGQADEVIDDIPEVEYSDIGTQDNMMENSDAVGVEHGLPIYQTYVLETLYNETDRNRQNLGDPKIRKCMVAVLLRICKKYNWEIPYVGVEVAYHLSNQCIRDFLNIMHSLYVNSGATNVDEFIAKPISQENQRKAFYSASEKKKDAVVSNAPFAQNIVSNIVQTLGDLLAKLQSDVTNNRSLATPERGLFVVKTASLPMEELKRCLAYINYAVDAGAVMLHDDVENICFSLHRLLAPKFGFSYRGPYGKVAIPLSEFLICATSNEGGLKQAKDNLISKVCSEDPQQSTLWEIKDESN